jgi:hypothetical protein
MLVEEMDTLCPSVIPMVERDIPCTFIVHTAGSGNGYLLHVPIACVGKGYILHLHTAVSEI